MMGTENHNFIHSSLAANENMAQQTHLEKKKGTVLSTLFFL